MNSVGDAFAYAFRDPRWPAKMIVQALILIIPIIGWIATTGWLMLAFENVRAGRMELPPAGFHISRGIGLFLVLLVYGIVIYVIPLGLLFVFGRTVPPQHTVTYRGMVSSTPASPLAANFFPLSFFLGLVFNFLVPSLIVNTNQRGILGGLDLTRVLRLATASPFNWVIAGLLSFVASIIGGFGVFGCCIGLLFTIVYQNAIQAGVAAWLEKVQAAPAA